MQTDMWGSTTGEFQAKLRPYIQISPLQAIRSEIDDKDLVESAENAGGRPAYATEIAGIVAMLCTADASWCTGQVVCANGGMRMAM